VLTHPDHLTDAQRERHHELTTACPEMIDLTEFVGSFAALPYHNGGTEGVNTKTKRIMRQMHGRAGFTLLRHRILLN
jgi:transposase